MNFLQIHLTSLIFSFCTRWTRHHSSDTGLVNNWYWYHHPGTTWNHHPGTTFMWFYETIQFRKRCETFLLVKCTACRNKTDSHFLFMVQREKMSLQIYFHTLTSSIHLVLTQNSTFRLKLQKYPSTLDLCQTGWGHDFMCPSLRLSISSFSKYETLEIFNNEGPLTISKSRFTVNLAQICLSEWRHCVKGLHFLWMFINLIE